MPRVKEQKESGMQGTSPVPPGIYDTVRLSLRKYATRVRLGRLAPAVLLSLFSACYLAILVFNALTLLTPPQLTLTLTVAEPGQAYIDWIIPGGALWERGVRVGDQIIALDQRAPQLEDAGSWNGQSITVRTRDAQVRVLTADILRQNHDTWSLLLLSPLFFLFGVLVYLRAQPLSVRYATFALFTSAALALGLAPAAVNERPIATALEFVMVTLFAGYFLRFFLTFPIIRGSQRFHMAIMVAPIGVSILGLAAMVDLDLYPAAVVLRSLVLAIYLLGSIGVLVYAQISMTHREFYRGLTILSLGTVVAILPFIVLYILPTLVHGTPVVAAEHAILPLGILPASFTYAILRHSVLNVPLIQRWLLYGVVWAGLILLYTLILIPIQRLLMPLPEWVRPLTLIAILVLMISISFERFQYRLRRWIDHRIFKDNYNYREALQQLAGDLSMARDLDTLGEALPARLQSLINVSFAALLIRSQNEIYIHAGTGDYSPEQIIATARANQIQHTASIVPSVDDDAEILLAPLLIQGTIVGYICLGPKVSGEPFRREDRDLLSTLSGHVAAIVCTEQLVDVLRSKVDALNMLNEQLERAQEAERARLSADIHDEPLQTALQLQRALTNPTSQQSAASPLILSQTLVKQLRQVCTTMRPATLDHLGLIAALDALTQEQSEYSNVPITLNLDSSVVDLALTPDAELVLYRAAQEAINNSLRHANPSTIQVVLRQQDDTIELLVSDDGHGFIVPSHLSSLVAHKHLGLAGLQDRVQKIGGRVEVSSSPGQGTIIRVDIPLEVAVL